MTIYFGCDKIIGTIVEKVGKEMLRATVIDDMKKMQNYYDNIDYCAKYRSFFKDVLIKRNDMLKKEQRYIDEYIEYMKKIIKIEWPFVITAFMAIVYVVFYFFLQWKSIIPKDISFIDYFVSVFSVFENRSIMGLKAAMDILVVSSLVIFLPFHIYTIVGLIKIPYRLIRYIKAKAKVKKYMIKQLDLYNFTTARTCIELFDIIINTEKKSLDKLFERYCFDSRLRSRFAVGRINELIKINKNKDIELKDITNYILKNEKITSDFPLDKWGQALLLYDENFMYYSFENPLLKKYKEKDEKVTSNATSLFLYILSLPYRFIFFFFKWGAMFLPISNNGKPKVSSESDQATVETTPFRWNTMSETAQSVKSGTFCFYDADGCYTSSDSLFHDYKGYLVSPGGNFHDSRGNYCDKNSCFYDAEGNYCIPGGPFVDSKGYLHFP